MEEDAPSSPKRKKVRAKYASSVSCRRSKLKCSGENPCQRCVDNGKRCFYSEDQTAAEALQNLSRPTPVQAHATLASNDNNNGTSRRNLVPHNESIERRASDASVLGLSMEARMARIESMMESLMLERGMAMTPRISMERDAAASERLHADFLMQIAGEASLSSFPPMTHAEFALESPEGLRHSVSAVSPSANADTPATLRVGTKTLTFPNPADYQRYLDVFFEDINPYYPCINEAEFRMGSEKLLSSPAFQLEDMSLLALNYIIFACSDIASTIVTGVTDSASYVDPPGWQWFHAADDLVGKRKMSGQADLCLIQFLTLEAVYMMYADKADAAYNVIGISCRLCFQAGLHQQSSWRTYTPFDIHMHQRIFWTVYFLDRRISLSCGRPYSIRESDIDIEQPAYLYDKDIHPDQPLPDPDVLRSSNMYLNCMVCWGRLAADVWDGLFAATASKDGACIDNARILDTRIKHWTEVILPTIPLLPPEYPPEPRQLRQNTIVHNSLDQLRLLLFRQILLSPRCPAPVQETCGQLARGILQRVKAHTDDILQPTSFRFHLATSLGSAIFLLAKWASLVPVNHFEDYNDATRLRNSLAQGLPLAHRIKRDFAEIDAVLQPYVNPTSPDFGRMLDPESPEINNLLPYISLDFAQQPGYSSGNAVPGDGDANGSGSTSALNTDLWNSVSKTKEGKYGAPWI